VAQERKHGVVAHRSSDITSQQVDHAAPVVRLNPGGVQQTHDGSGVNPVSVVKVVIVQCHVAAKGGGISDKSSPVAVVIEHIGVLVIGGAVEPILQLVLQAGLQIIGCGSVAGNPGNGEQVRDAGQIFPYVVGVSASTALADRKVIGFVGNRIDERSKSSIVGISRIGKERQDAVEYISRGKCSALQNLERAPA